MSFVVIGLNHATAPVDLLEQVTVAADDLPKALDDLARRPHISEAVVLSTCNRTEVYVEAEKFHGAFQDVRDFLAEVSFAPPEQVGDAIYTLYDSQAVEHLFRVGAGLDSAVVGEHEILGQVKRAWQTSQANGCVGPHLNRVFRAAIEAGKRVRTDTGIGRHVASVSQAAIVLAADRIGGLAGSRVLLIGAGEMGSGMALSLGERGTESITVMSRTVGTADELASRIGASVRPIDELPHALAECDIVFSSTAAPSVVLDSATIADAMVERSGRPLTLVDVAMPRDIDPAAAELAGVTVFDIDAVGAFVAEGIEQRAGELAEANAILDDELDRFSATVGAETVAPIITEFRSRVEQLRIDEVARQGRRFEDLTDDQRRAVDDITRAVLNKVLHHPTVRLKDSAASLRGERLAAALRELFDLS